MSCRNLCWLNYSVLRSQMHRVILRRSCHKKVLDWMFCQLLRACIQCHQPYMFAVLPLTLLCWKLNPDMCQHVFVALSTGRHKILWKFMSRAVLQVFIIGSQGLHPAICRPSLTIMSGNVCSSRFCQSLDFHMRFVLSLRVLWSHNWSSLRDYLSDWYICWSINPSLCASMPWVSFALCRQQH